MGTWVLILTMTLSGPVLAGQERAEANGGDSSPLTALQDRAGKGDVDWEPLLRQSALFLGVQHAVRFATQEGTRGNLRGPWVRDYFQSVRGLPGWNDNDSVLANYVGHPMQGSVYGNLFVASHARDRKVPFRMKRDYWGARLRAMAFSFASSTQYELGPLGEAAWGDVGKDPHTKGMVDMVTTPTLGLAWQFTEDLLDEKLIVPFENRARGRWARLLLRASLNPTRSMSNMLRFKVPWHRDTRPGVSSYARGNGPLPRGAGQAPPGAALHSQ